MSQQPPLSKINLSSTFETYSPFPNFVSQKEALIRIKAITDYLISSQTALLSHDRRRTGKGSLVFLTGDAGAGKTHLLEAMTNELRQKAPELLGHTFLNVRDNFVSYLDNLRKDIRVYPFAGKPVAVIDDIFHNYHTENDLYYHKALPTLMMDFINHVYEDGVIVIATSGYSFENIIYPMLLKQGANSGILSRYRSIMDVPGGELLVKGPDYRSLEKLMTLENSKDPFLLEDHSKSAAKAPADPSYQ